MFCLLTSYRLLFETVSSVLQQFLCGCDLECCSCLYDCCGAAVAGGAAGDLVAGGGDVVGPGGGDAVTGVPPPIMMTVNNQPEFIYESKDDGNEEDKKKDDVKKQDEKKDDEKKDDEKYKYVFYYASDAPYFPLC